MSGDYWLVVIIKDAPWRRIFLHIFVFLFYFHVQFLLCIWFFHPLAGIFFEPINSFFLFFLSFPLFCYTIRPYWCHLYGKGQRSEVRRYVWSSSRGDWRFEGKTATFYFIYFYLYFFHFSLNSSFLSFSSSLFIKRIL